MADKPKVQRIKMRMRDHLVKLDGSVTEMDPEGNWFFVVFDGPVPDTKFWNYAHGSLAVDKEPIDNGGGSHTPAPGTRFWDVL